MIDGGINSLRLTTTDFMNKSADLNTSSKENICSSEKNKKNGMFYNPDHYLEGYLKEAFKLALKNKKNVLLDGLLQSIIILYQTREVFVKRNGESLFAVNKRSLCALSGVPLTNVRMSMSILTNSYDAICKFNGLLISYDFMIWKLAVRASQGRIPEGTDLSRQMSLIEQPNISRLRLTSDALKIAALWVEQPCTLSMTAQMLGIPQREVFSFFSAVTALDLIGRSDLYVEPEFRIGGMDEGRRKALKKENMFNKIKSKIRSLSGFKSEVDLYEL